MVCRSAGQCVGLLGGQSVGQLVGLSGGRSVDQLLRPLVGLLVVWSFGQLVC